MRIARVLHRVVLAPALTVLLLLAPASVFAQSTAEIRGTIQDESGAILPGATAIAINELTGLERTTTSDEAGRFNIPRLPVGTYRVEAMLQGFRKFATAPFRLDVEDIRQVNIVMQVGAVEEGITVSGIAATVETVGGTLSQIVDERRIRELPLNGRDPLQLQLLLPGVVQGNGATTMQQQGGISVHGLRGISNNYMLDSGDNNDVLGGVAAIVPNPDALEEFTVQTSNFGAQYGRNMGAVINAVTKSGTNQFHGSGYDFTRNDALDAKQFFALQKGELKRYQYGGTLGGPIKHDRAFFFAAYQGLNERKGESRSNLTVPTALERSGDFSLSAFTPKDPLTGQPFPNNRIPLSRFDPASIKFMEALVPLPNAPGGRYIYNAPQDKDGWQAMARMDMQLTAKQRLFGRVFYDTNDTVNTANSPAPSTAAGSLPDLHAQVSFRTWNAAINHTDIISSHLLNSAQFTFAKTDLFRGPLPVGDDLNYQKLGVRVNYATADPGVKLATMWRGGVSGYWDMNQDAYEPDDRPVVQLKDDVSYSRSGHGLKLGGEYRWAANNRVAANNNDPVFTFNGQYTGSPLADFLLGKAANVQQFSVRHNRGRAQTFAAYAQDDWEIRSRLTLSLGLRWEPFFAFYEVDQPQPVFRPGQQSTLYPTAPIGLLYAGDPGIPRGGHPTLWGNMAPRLAAAWSVDKRTSVRTAYGKFYDTARFFNFPKTLVFTPPYSLSRTTNDVQFSDPYGGKVNPFPYAPPQTAQDLANYQFSRPVRVTSYPADFSSGYAQQWNLSIQRELIGNLIVSAAYIGTKADDLPTTRQINPAIFKPGATLATRQQNRLYPEYESISSFDPIGRSRYDGLELTLNKRFSRGYSILASYTLSKAKDNTSSDDGFNAQDQLNPDDNWGLADTDQRHRLVTSFVWELPSPKAGTASLLFGGWQFNGIVTLASGTPFTISSGRDAALNFNTTRANVVGDPNLSSDRPRDELIAAYYNAAAFTIPVNGTLGNSPRNFLIGPGSKNVDLSLFKTLTLRDVRVQARIEAFNAFNFVNFGNPRANIGAANPGRIDTAADARIIQIGVRMTF
jgi:outer membrane receptor protein involved in Fe transport